jgi:preprotein translocase subunit SecF
MIIMNPRKWDIIGKLRWLILAFLAVIIVSSLIVGIRWITTGTTADEIRIIFKEPIASEEDAIIEEASKIAIENKLDNLSVSVLPESADFKAKQRINIQALSIPSDIAAKISEGIQTKFGAFESEPTKTTVRMPGQPFNWGLDFTGGTIMDMTFVKNFTDNGEPMSDEKVITIVRRAFATHGVSINTLQVQRNVEDAKSGKTWANAVLVRTQEASDAKRKAVIEELSKPENFGEINKDKLSIDTIGPVVGQELKNNMLTALLIALGLIFIYISFRFQPRAAVAAVACLIHDTLFTFGVLALTNIEINSPAVAALLAVIAYDVQDTVVVMDRVRENTKFYAGRMTYAQMINDSITETYTRSFNTAMTTMLGIIVLMIFGGRTILDFTLIFFLGLFAGTWSSIYIAAPLLVIWKNVENKIGKNREVPVQIATASAPSLTVSATASGTESRPQQQTYRKGPPASKRKGSKKRR